MLLTIRLKSLSTPKKIVHKSDIPDEYKHLKVLNKNAGATSLVLEKDKDTVLILTRDSIKREWLVIGSELGKHVTSLEIHNRRIRGSEDAPVYIIEMPRLLPLSLTNKRRVAADTKKFNKLFHQFYRNSKLTRSQDRKIYTTSDTLEALKKEDPKNILIPYLRWVVNYDKYEHDLGTRNFMQTKAGNLVVLDPVVSEKVISMMYS